METEILKLRGERERGSSLDNRTSLLKRGIKEGNRKKGRERNI